jgi:hypothetical protein
MSLRKRSKILLVLLLVIVVGGISVYNYMYKSHTPIEELSTDFLGTSKEFSTLLLSNPEQWSGKTVEVTGKVTDFKATEIALEGNVFCLTTKEVVVKQNQTLTIKGKVAGYDELLEEVKLINCIIKN